MDIKIKRGDEEKEEKEEGRIDEWDMPVSTKGREIPMTKSQIPNESEAAVEEKPGSKFQDARPKIQEIAVPINFQKALSYWKGASRWLLILFASLTPIFFLPFTDLPVAANKEILVFILILVSLFASLGRILIEGRIRYPGHLITTAFLLLVLVWGIASFFSVYQIGSLIGSFATPDSFAAVLLFSILAISIMMTFDRSDIIISLLVFLASLSVLGIFESLQLMKIFILPFDFSKNAVFNPIGSINSLGILLAFGLILATGLLIPRINSENEGFSESILKKLLGISIIILLINLVIIDFWAIWIGLALAMIFLISFLSIGLGGRSGSTRIEADQRGNYPRESADNPRKSASMEGLQLAYFQKAWLPSIILLISLFLLFIPSPLTRLIQPPGEVSLSFRATINIALANLKTGSYFLGSGPNTFGYIYNLYKPAAINQTVLWSTVFNSGASTMTAWLGTVGIFGILAILFLIGVFIWIGIYRSGSTRMEADQRGNYPRESASRAIFVAVIFMFAMWFLYPLDFTVTAFAFWGIGIFLAMNRSGSTRIEADQRGNYPRESADNPRKSASREILIFTSPPKTFLFSLLIVALMVGTAAGVYFETNRYVAEIYFGRALKASSGRAVSAGTIGNLSKAIEFWPYDERYFETMSQAVFLQLNDLLSKKDLPQETLRSQFQNLTSNAIAYAQRARGLNSKNQFNAALLGSIYENLIPFTADAAGFALSLYEEAAALDPQNPSNRLAMARVQIAQANSAASKKADALQINGYLDKAAANLEEAIRLKSDYAPARFLEVQIFDRQGKLTDAVRRAEELAIFNNSDVGALFQLGFLYYKSDRFDESRLVLERVVSLSPNYSNARYFLGLIYDKNGARDSAVEQFSKIAELNPDNNEVKQILANLRAKKPALFKVAPPLAAPQNRSEAPVSEGAKAPVQKLRK